jgi:hypothetical protein
MGAAVGRLDHACRRSNVVFVLLVWDCNITVASRRTVGEDNSNRKVLLSHRLNLTRDDIYATVWKCCSSIDGDALHGEYA